MATDEIAGGAWPPGTCMMERPSTPRVLLVAPLPPPMGGIARWTQQLVDRLRDNPSVTVRVLDTSIRWRAVGDTRPWVRIVGGVVQGIRDMGKAVGLIAWWRPTVVHLCTTAGFGLLRDAVVIALCALARTPVVYHVRMGRFGDGSHRAETRVFGRLAALVSVVLVLDEATEAAVRRLGRIRSIQRVPNFVDTDRTDDVQRRVPLAAADTTPVTIVYVGWVLPSKGVFDLIEAFAAVPGGTARLDLVGPAEASVAGQVIRRSEELGVRADVSLLGDTPHEDVLRKMAAADVVVLPSHSEGFPNVILEAMALGRAILATDVGAIRGMLQPAAGEPAGIVVPVRSPGVLGAELARLVADRDLRAHLGSAARRRARDEYSASVIVPRYVGLWTSLSRRARAEPAPGHTGLSVEVFVPPLSSLTGSLLEYVDVMTRGLAASARVSGVTLRLPDVFESRPWGVPIESYQTVTIGPLPVSWPRRRTPHADVVLSVVARPTGVRAVPVVTVAQNAEPLQQRLYPVSTIWRVRLAALRAQTLAACREAACVIAPSGHMKQMLVDRGIPASRVSVVHHGIRPREGCQPPQALRDATAPFVFAGGSLVPYRGTEDAIRAVARTAGLKLVVAGTSASLSRDYQRSLVRLAATLGIADRVVWAGHLLPGEMTWCFRHAVAVLQTSRAESFSTYQVEALSQGAPLISTDQPPMPEILGEAAAYYAPGDWERLSALIGAAMARDAETRARDRDAAVARANRFAWPASVARTVEILARCVEESRAGQARPDGGDRRP